MASAVDDRDIIPARFVPESAREIRLSESAWSCNQQRVLIAYPLVRSKAEKLAPVKFTWDTIVDILECRGQFELGDAQSILRSFVGLLGGLAIEEKSQPLFMAEVGGGGIAAKLQQRVDHPGEPAFAQLVDGGFVEHGGPPQWK